jgi:hypothetical protein
MFIGWRKKNGRSTVAQELKLLRHVDAFYPRTVTREELWNVGDSASEENRAEEKGMKSLRERHAEDALPTPAPKGRMPKELHIHHPTKGIEERMIETTVVMEEDEELLPAETEPQHMKIGCLMTKTPHPQLGNK